MRGHHAAPCPLRDTISPDPLQPQRLLPRPLPLSKLLPQQPSAAALAGAPPHIHPRGIAPSPAAAAEAPAAAAAAHQASALPLQDEEAGEARQQAHFLRVVPQQRRLLLRVAAAAGVWLPVRRRSGCIILRRNQHSLHMSLSPRTHCVLIHVPGGPMPCSTTSATLGWSDALAPVQAAVQSCSGMGSVSATREKDCAEGGACHLVPVGLPRVPVPQAGA